VKQNAVVVQDFAAVSFAVPIGVPVAQVTPAFYSYNAAASAYHPRASANVANGLGYRDMEEYQTWSNRANEDDKFKAWVEWRAMKAKDAAVQSQAAIVSPFQKVCLSCHSQGGAGFAHHDFSKPLTADDRLDAIDAIVQGKMPKGRPLDPQVRADIVAELSKRETKVKAAVVPPQPQGESK
jgi:mono/diheme cytochrome c family protein